MKKIVCLMSITLLLSFALYLPASETEESGYDEDLYGPESPVVWETPVKGVIFDHKIHTMEAELSCDDCHDDIFEMETGIASESEDFTMEAMEDGEYCGTCHDGETAFSSSSRCTFCHIGVRGVNRMQSGYDQVDTSH